MFCEDGWVDIVTVSVAAFTVMVFIAKLPLPVREIVLPDVWPVTPLQLVGQ